MIYLRLLSYIEKNFKQTGKVGKKGEVNFWCPVCKLEKYKQKLSINLDRDSDKFGNWHCWNCQVSNKMSGKNIFTLFNKVGLNNENIISGLNELLEKKIIKSNIFENEKNITNKKIITLPKEFKSLYINSNSPEFKNAINYLYMRGVTDNDIVRYNIGYCENGEYSNRIIIPSYNKYGQLNYFVSRSYYKAKKKYLNPSIDKNDIIIFEMHINWNYPIIIVEGVFDSIAAGSNSIPILGKNISNKLKESIIVNKVDTIYLSLDSDAIKTSIKYIEEFLKSNINVYFIDLGKTDPSNLGKHKFRQLYKDAKLMNFENLMKLKLSMVF